MLFFLLSSKPDPCKKKGIPPALLLKFPNLVASQGLGASAVPLFGDGKLDATALGQGDPRLLAADDEDVGLAGSEGVVDGVLEVDDVEASVVALAVGDDTNTAHVTTTGDHGDGAGIELDEVLDLASLEVDLHGVVDPDRGVGVSDTVEKNKFGQQPEGDQDIPTV